MTSCPTTLLICGSEPNFRLSEQKIQQLWKAFMEAMAGASCSNDHRRNLRSSHSRPKPRSTWADRKIKSRPTSHT